MLRKGLVAAAIWAVALATPANASVTISFAGGNSATSGTSGNIATYSNGAVSVQASAWSYNGLWVSKAWLGQYSDGLGVTNAGENGTTNNSNAIDNVSGDDLVLLVFNQPVSLVSAVLTPYQVASTAPDNDVTTSMATLAGAFTSPTPTPIAANSTIWLSLLLGANSVSGNNTSPYLTALTPGTGYGNVWLLGADESGLDTNADGFHLSSINVNSSPVPEPSTTLMMAFGLAAIGWMAMRSRGLPLIGQVA